MFYDLDRAVDAVARNADAWTRVPIVERLALARRCIDGCVATADAIVHASCRAKGLDPASHFAAEEWLSGPVPVVRNLRLLIDTLSEIDRTGTLRVQTLAPGSHDGDSDSPSGVTINIFPNDIFDRLLYPGVHINVRMQPDVTAENLAQTVAIAYTAASMRRAIATRRCFRRGMPTIPEASGVRVPRGRTINAPPHRRRHCGYIALHDDFRSRSAERRPRVPRRSLVADSCRDDADDRPTTRVRSSTRPFVSATLALRVR